MLTVALLAGWAEADPAVEPGRNFIGWVKGQLDDGRSLRRWLDAQPEGWRAWWTIWVSSREIGARDMLVGNDEGTVLWEHRSKR